MELFAVVEIGQDFLPKSLPLLQAQRGAGKFNLSFGKTHGLVVHRSGDAQPGVMASESFPRVKSTGK